MTTDIAATRPDPGRSRVLRVLAALPLKTVSVEVAAGACELPCGTVERHLHDLLEAGLLEAVGEPLPVTGPRFRLLRPGTRALDQGDRFSSPTVPSRQVLRSAANSLLISAAAAQRSLEGRYYAPGNRCISTAHPPRAEPIAWFNSTTAALGWLTETHDIVMHIIRAASAVGEHQHCWRLTAAVLPYWLWTQDLTTWLEAHRLAMKSAQLCDDRRAYLELGLTLGTGLRKAGQLDEAAVLLATMLYTARDNGHYDQFAQALHCLGRTRQAAGDLPAAEGLLRQAHSARLELSDTRGTALVLLALGRLAVDQQRWDQAVADLNEAKGLLTRYDYRYDAARALACLGRARTAQGAYDTANAELTTALKTLEVCHSAPPWRARVLEYLGETAQARGDTAQARTYYQAALAITPAQTPADTTRLATQVEA